MVPRTAARGVLQALGRVHRRRRGMDRRREPHHRDGRARRLRPSLGVRPGGAPGRLGGGDDPADLADVWHHGCRAPGLQDPVLRIPWQPGRHRHIQGDADGDHTGHRRRAGGQERRPDRSGHPESAARLLPAAGAGLPPQVSRLMRRVSRDRASLFFDPRAEPVIEVAAGERFVVETADSLCGLVKREAPKGFAIDDVIDRLGGACPVTGPIYVAGATSGGVIEVHIEDVRAVPARGEAWTGVFAGFGALTSAAFSIQAPPEPVTTLVSYDGDAALLDLGGRRARIPVRPFLGTVGVAPRRERRMSFSQSPEYLGDVDLPELTGGAAPRPPGPPRHRAGGAGAGPPPP